MLVLLLQLLLIGARLDGVIEWPWLVVLAPTYITLGGFWLFGPPFSYSFYELDPDEEEND